MDIPQTKGVPIKSFKQRKVGIPKASSSQLQSQNNTPEPELTNIIPNDNIDYLQQLINEKLFNKNGNINNINNRTVIKDYSLPPLTSSNDLDIRLYALFSLLINDFIFGWYENSLNLDEKDQFTKELIFIFAHISRNLQERINKSHNEFIKLLITDLPYLLNDHLNNLNEISCLLARDGFRKINEIEQDNILINEWLLRYSDGLTNDEKIIIYRRYVVKSIVCLILPHENTESNISREFLVSLLDGVVLKNIIDSFCDSFVIWDIIGKICQNLNNSNNNNNNKYDKISRKKSIIHSLFKFFIVEETYEINTDDLLTFSDFIPLFNLINFLTLFNIRFPLLTALIQVILQIMLNINFLKKIINNAINRIISQHLLTQKNLEKLVDSLRHLMFINDNKFGMKPRYIPQNNEELQIVYDENLNHLKTFLSKRSKISTIFISKNDSFNENIVEEKAKYIMSVFKNRQVNQTLIRKMIDLLLSKIFPELQTQDIVSQYKIHQ